MSLLTRSAVGDSIISPGVPWSSTATAVVYVSSAQVIMMTWADDTYTTVADTEEEDIDHFLPPPPAKSLLEMCGSTNSATQPVPVVHSYDYHY